MAGARAVRAANGSDSSHRLYDRIGEFLVDQRLDPDPGNYAFAYHLLADPEGPLARAVHALTDGGVRLTQRDIETLGCDLQPVQNGKGAKEKADGLVAQTQMQVEGFQDMRAARSRRSAPAPTTGWPGRSRSTSSPRASTGYWRARTGSRSSSAPISRSMRASPPARSSWAKRRPSWPRRAPIVRN